MLEGATVMVLALLITLVIAMTALVGLALVRRPADQWQKHLREQNGGFQTKKLDDAPIEDIDPTVTTLTNLMAVSSTDESAYFDADRLPGVDRIEQVTDRIEAYQEGRRSSRS